MLPNTTLSFVPATFHRVPLPRFTSASKWSPLPFQKHPSRRTHSPRHYNIAHTAKASLKTVTFIGGGGKMGTALITALQTSRNPPKIIAVSPRKASLSHLKLSENLKQTDNLSAVQDADLVFLCVKPDKVSTVLSEISPAISGPTSPLLVSVVAGYTIPRIQTILNNSNLPVIRAMPNIAAGVNFSATCVCASDCTTEEQMSVAESMIGAIGPVSIIPESQFPVFTALSGSGVAYIFMIIEALSDAGVRHGLSREGAIKVVAQAVAGAGLLAAEDGARHPAVLRNAVESPGGCTVVGTRSLEESGIRAAMHDAVDAVVDRMAEMGGRKRW